MLTTEKIEAAIRSKKYPYQNDRTANLKGEKWKMIPESNDAYMMSNFGRVKSIGRNVYRKNGTVVYVPGQMKKALIHRARGVSKYHPERVAYAVDNSINIEGHKYRITVARYLYYLFIKKFDLTDWNMKVTFKDGNHLNLSLDNLKLSTISDVMKREFANGKIRMRYRCKARKVAQYDLKGKFISEYPSMTVAAHATGIHNASIYRTVIGKFRQTKGFIFREIE